VCCVVLCCVVLCCVVLCCVVLCCVVLCCVVLCCVVLCCVVLWSRSRMESAPCCTCCCLCACGLRQEECQGQGLLLWHCVILRRLFCFVCVLRRVGCVCGVMCQPSFPASSPYVLSVSGTVLAPSATSRRITPHRTSPEPLCGTDNFGYPIVCNGSQALEHVQEIAAMCCSDGTVWTGAGGFSDNFTRPSWQDEAVESYFELSAGDLPPANMWNRTNRGFPDVSALSDQVLIYRNGAFQISGGTSAASPITAGLLALVNDARMRNNRPPLGFVAPWLYKVAAKVPGAFNDVVIGDNKCGELICCDYGFKATKVRKSGAVVDGGGWEVCAVGVWLLIFL